MSWNDSSKRLRAGTQRYVDLDIAHAVNRQPSMRFRIIATRWLRFNYIVDSFKINVFDTEPT